MAAAAEKSKTEHVYNVHEAKTQLSKLLDLASSGEEVIIAKAGEPCVRLTPVEPHSKLPKERVLGLSKGKFWMADDFNDPLPELEEFFS